MEEFEVFRYTPTRKLEWNDFVGRSKQGTFLFDRNYMDYHHDRFQDYSLMVFRNARLFALFPANRVDNTVYSHQGLTYGGLLTDHKATTAEVCTTFQVINHFLREQDVNRVIYKAIPWIYHNIPAEEDLYALTNVCQAQLIARDISSAIILDSRLKFTESRRSGIRKAVRNELFVEESEDIDAFWDILNRNLQNKYGATPVHSSEELRLLHGRFPRNIKLFMVYDNNVAVGGTLVYVTPQVVHTQYISASPEGKSMGALDLLFDHLINKVEWGRRYFDFGKSTEDGGRVLNAPLIFQKEGFGGRGVCYDCYEWRV